MFWFRTFLISAVTMILFACAALILTLVTAWGWASLIDWVGALVYVIVVLALVVATAGIAMIVKEFRYIATDSDKYPEQHLL